MTLEESPFPSLLCTSTDRVTVDLFGFIAAGSDARRGGHWARYGAACGHARHRVVRAWNTAPRSAGPATHAASRYRVGTEKSLKNWKKEPWNKRLGEISW